MKQIFFTIIILSSIQLNAQDSDTISTRRPLTDGYLNLIGQTVGHNAQLLTEYDSIYVFNDGQIIDKIDLDRIRDQMMNRDNYLILDSVIDNNTVEYCLGHNLIMKKIFDSQKKLITKIEYDCDNSISTTNYKYSKYDNSNLERTSEFWFAPPDSCFEQETITKYNDIYWGKKVCIKKFDKNRNIISSDTRSFSHENKIGRCLIAEFAIDESSNQITKVRFFVKRGIDADFEYADANFKYKDRIIIINY